MGWIFIMTELRQVGFVYKIWEEVIWNRPKRIKTLSPEMYYKLPISTNINPKHINWYVGMEKDSLGEKKAENDTNNFGCWLLCHTAINWMMKYDRQGVITYNFYIMYIMFVQNVDEFLICRACVCIWELLLGILLLLQFKMAQLLQKNAKKYLREWLGFENIHIEELLFWKYVCTGIIANLKC